MPENEPSAPPGLEGAPVTRGKKYIEYRVPPDGVPAACSGLIESPELYHLSTITGLDAGDKIGILYHFWQGDRFLVVATEVPKTSPRLPSISGIIPGSTLYEAEVKDFFGVTFEGNPYSDRRLLLPDGYPAGAPPPLLKEADPEAIRKMMGLE